MADSDNDRREQENRDARKLATVLRDSQKNDTFNNLVGIALASYMNGIKDACASFKAVSSPAV